MLYSAVDPVAIYASPVMQHVGIGHTADGMLTTCQSYNGVGIDLYACLEFWTFFQARSQGVDLYADSLICGNTRYLQY